MSKKTVIEQMIGLLRTPITQRKGINIPSDECLIWAGELEKELKSLPERFTLQPEQKWSEEDEKIVTGIINDIQERLEDYPTEQLAEIYFKEIKWLKSLKPQPKQQWSEEDEKMLNDIDITLFEENSIPNVKYWKFMNWLKSIKQRIGWKPSEEQMQALKEACDKRWEPDGLDPLYALYEQLKKL